MSFFQSLFGNGGSYSNVGNAILSGLGSMFGGDDESDAAKEAAKRGGIEGRQTLLFQKRLEDFYTQRDRAEKRDAFKNYTQFSSLASLAPQYRNVHKPVEAYDVAETAKPEGQYDEYVKEMNRNRYRGGGG